MIFNYLINEYSVTRYLYSWTRFYIIDYLRLYIAT